MNISNGVGGGSMHVKEVIYTYITILLVSVLHVPCSWSQSKIKMPIMILSEIYNYVVN